MEQHAKPTMTDFIMTPGDKMGVCSTGQPVAGGLDEIVKAIGASIWDNATCVAIAIGVITASLAVTWYAGSEIYKAILEWRKHQLRGRPERAQTGSDDRRDDDVSYAYSTASDGIPSDLGPPPAAPIVAARMAKLAQRYKLYNAAIRQTAAEKGLLADDLMDASILDRANDDWVYPRRAIGGAGAGASGSRPWALRSPVYGMNP